MHDTVKHPLISVIIPVYNVAPYLPRCLESVCNQTYQNLEIILVDDGSTDKSLPICQQYAQKDNRITIIHQKNGCLQATVLYGFSHPKNRTKRNAENRRIGQALGLLVQPGTHVAMLTPVAYQPGSLPGTLLAYAMGNLILRLASCLDAFSVYPIRT